LNQHKSEVIERQQALCKEHGSEFVLATPDEIAGFASRTSGRAPLNGLRHPNDASSSGWYFWCGEDFSQDNDFFQPIHLSHLYENFPEIAPLLGLEPGFRFLAAGHHLDVWFDEKLLDLKEKQ